MRQNVALVVACVFVLQVGLEVIRPRLRGREAVPVRDADLLCEDNEPEQHGAISSDDQILRNDLVRLGTALIEQGRAVDAKLLVQQLARNRCPLDLPQPKRPATNRAELFRTAKDSIVVVGGVYKCKKCTKWHASLASGFVIASSGAVVTNYHVVNNPITEAMVVMTADRRVFPVKAILAASRGDDLAILQVEAEGLTPLPVATSAAPVSADVTVISHPVIHFYCCTSGIVSRYMKAGPADQQFESLVITADFARGSSGAPVLNGQGQVIAIVKSTDSVYSESAQQQRNVQMVFKMCIPVRSLHKLIGPS